MTKKTDNSLKLRSWYSNKYQLVLVQKKILSIFSILAMFTVVIAVIFVKKFTESKSFEPYVVELEEKTGVLSVVDNVSKSVMTYDEAIKKFYIYSFLEVAEGYRYETFLSDKKKLLLFTTPNVYRLFSSKYNINNEKSIYNILKGSSILKIKIKSIIFTTPQTVSVRFAVINSNPTRSYPRENHLIANIDFRITPNMILTDEERYINPLGFQVYGYFVGKDMNF